MSIRQFPRMPRAPKPEQVVQWADSFLDVLTSILTAPSQNGLVGMDQFRSVASASGSLKLPSTASALQIGWGTDSIANATTTKAVTFTTAFPQSCWVVLISQTGASGPFAFKSSSVARTGFTATANNAGTACDFFYVAIGN